MPPIVSVIGKANSGKTTLLEKLIPELNRRGYKIGTIKHHVHEFDMDKRGKDTWRHKQAGARIVALSSPSAVGIIRDTERDLSVEELANQYFTDVDLVITEGYKRATAPKIEIFRTAVHESPLASRDDTWIAMVCDKPQPDSIPQFNLDDIQALASFIENSLINPISPEKIELHIAGEEITLPHHSKSLIAKALAGIVSSSNQLSTSPKKIAVTISDA
jgi:molybdopterin-guanine dinucleotide biosynthesis protein B